MRDSIEQNPVLVWTGAEMLEGVLRKPGRPRAVVVFANASAHARFDPCNRELATQLYRLGFATILADLLTPDEAQFDSRTGHFRNDIELLAGRLHLVAGWVRRSPDTHGLPIGYCATGTAAAAALLAASQDDQGVFAIVSRSGRPDLAGDALAKVTVPVLLVAGVLDCSSVCRSREAFDSIGGTRRIEIFGDLDRSERATKTICEWFSAHVPLMPALRGVERTGAREDDMQDITAIDGSESLGYSGRGHEEHSGVPVYAETGDPGWALANNEPDEIMFDFDDYVR